MEVKQQLPQQHQQQQHQLNEHNEHEQHIDSTTSSTCTDEAPSEHTQSMRDALQYCMDRYITLSSMDDRNGINTLRNYFLNDDNRSSETDNNNKNNSCLDEVDDGKDDIERHERMWMIQQAHSMVLNQRRLQHKKQQSQQHERSTNDINSTICQENMNKNTIDIVDNLDENNDNYYKFIERYQIGNRPCLIRNMEHYFHNFCCSEWTIPPVTTRKTTTSNESARRRSNKMDDDQEVMIVQNQDECSGNLNKNTNQKRRINSKWFEQNLGSHTLVPVICTYSATTASSPGSSSSCFTKKMMITIKDWIDLLQRSETDDSESLSLLDTSCYYLKDWHFQLLVLKQDENKKNDTLLLQDKLESRTAGLDDDDNMNDFLAGDKYVNQDDDNYVDTKKKYWIYSNNGDGCQSQQPPEFFQYDLLNDFLINFTNGDYRFVYWGPKQSYTSIHTDVLNTFSWSYNVFGTKEWTFYYSNKNHDDDDEVDDDNNEQDAQQQQQQRNSVTFTQKAGEIVFVPSAVQHSVRNLEETISINHNWITTSNLFHVWDCIQNEIHAIDIELSKWEETTTIASRSSCRINKSNCFGYRNATSTPSTTSSPTKSCANHINIMYSIDDWERKENMLRGCVGLDITSFVLMMLVRLFDILVLLLQQQQQRIQQLESTKTGATTSIIKNGKTSNVITKKMIHLFYDVIQLIDMIQIVKLSDTTGFEERILSILGSIVLSNQLVDLINVVQDVLGSISTVGTTCFT